MSIKNRKSNIELLRIFACIGVIILHFVGRGIKYFEGFSINSLLLYYIEAVSICSVDLFMLISGYFMCNQAQRSVKKIGRLLSQYWFVTIGMYVVGVFIGKHKLGIAALIELIVPKNYFLVFYIIVYLFSPYINIMLEQLDCNDRRRLRNLLIGIFSIYSTAINILMCFTGVNTENMNPVCRNGDLYGYSIVQFFIMYILGALLNKENNCYKKSKSIILWQCNILLIFSIAVFVDFVLLKREFTLDVVWAYSNPLIIFSAVNIFRVFKEIDIGCIKGVNTFAKASFMVYLFHPYIFAMLDFSFIKNFNILQLVIVLIILAITTYVISFFVYIIWEFTFNRVESMFEKRYVSEKR